MEHSIGFEAIRRRLNLESPPKQQDQLDGLHFCPDTPPGLMGPEFTEEQLNDLDSAPLQLRKEATAKLGGSWAPSNCRSQQILAIIIPYKNRFRNLMTLVPYLHPFLQRQQCNYTIYVVEQMGKALGMRFNKGRLMNAAVAEISRRDPAVNCLLMQDVDLLPMDDRNLYRCADMHPKHLSPAVDELNYQQPYDYLIGGALAMRPLVYRSVNGFSNSFWGWGGEDDDLFNRFNDSGYAIQRPNNTIGRFWALPHKKRFPAYNSYLTDMLLELGHHRVLSDGINQIQRMAKVVLVEKKALWTHLWIDVGKAPNIRCNQTHCNNRRLAPTERMIQPTKGPKKRKRKYRKKSTKDV